MGKRQRRRQRQQRNRLKQQQKAQRRHLLPSAQRPLLEVCFEDGVSEDHEALCLAYWEFDEPGAWTRKVAELGSSSMVLRIVKASCHANVLTLMCPQCADPITVKSRSDLANTGLWRPDVFPTAEQRAKVPCDACREVAADARRAAEQRAQEEHRKRSERRAANASAWVADHRGHSFPDEPLSAQEALTLLTVIDIMDRKDSESFGPLNKADYFLGASHSTDVETLKNLHQQRWIAPTLPAAVDDFAYMDDDTVRGVYVERVPWRLAHALGDEAPQARRETADEMQLLLLDSMDELKETGQELDAVTAVMYLDNLLMRKYSEEPVPEHRMQEAYDTFRDALRGGFTLGQLLAVAWSATASSVAWGQRTPGLRPGSVSSAAVTNLGRRLGYASDRPVPVYDLPNWVTLPATRATLLRLLEQHRAESEALHRFRSLQQRIGSRQLEALELDGDLAEAADSGRATTESLSFPDFLVDSRGDGPVRKPLPPLTYALVTPDGSFEFRTESAKGMRERVGAAGAGLVDRIVLDEPATVHAYVAELVPARSKNANPVASEMLRLLGCHCGPFFGPISFFAVGQRGYEPSSLDEDQQEMLYAAHEVAHARKAASPGDVSGGALSPG
ncbi:hypothetical protein [Streptomyces cavernicola]|uniref:Uncharacterized protein n=1 Tax=Streptomyces cavernicola TaxID=3043613 RepID=A0ABT6S4C1_9ACTN|nr:hypothetical protein [Streptomyces sp. B-S-A6]MDI3402870.1 hypothetical protein [Streptomyces sp. B-S-A6]